MKYTVDSIKILSGIEGIKMRPEMYIGNITNNEGLYQLIYEIIDNSIDEAIIGKCNTIIIKVNKDKSISIRDNGRGIPVGIKLNDKYKIKRNAIEIICTELHSGGKFDNNTYNNSGGLHGLGISCVNALSEWLKVIVYTNKKIYFLKFYNSKIKNKYIEKFKNSYISPTNIISETKLEGTEIIFLPNKNYFKEFNYDENILIKRIKELSYLNKNLKLIFINKNFSKIEKFLSKNGIKDFIKNLNKNNLTLNKKILYIKKKIKNSIIEIGMIWNYTSDEKILCYTNNIYQINGGTHLLGFKTSLTKTINKYMIKNKFFKKKTIIGDDIRKGLICIISIKIPNPKFNSQTKNKLLTEEAKQITKKTTIKLLNKFFKKKGETKNLCKKILKHAEIRKQKTNIKIMNKKIKSKNKIISVTNKFSDCQEINPEKSEIFIVEGDSAGGSAKQCRDRKFQAILPLKGKILNVEKAKYDRLINSEQIITIIKSLGCGIETNFNIKNLKYKKVIIMTDADADGSHIRSLLLTFFFRYMPKLIELGYIYIAQPPLYRIKYKNKELYFKNNKSLEIFIEKNYNKNIDDFKYIKYKNKLSKKKLLKYIKLYIKIKKQIKKLNINYKIANYVINNNLKLNIKNTKYCLISAFRIKYLKIKKYKKFIIKIIFKDNFNKLYIKIKILKFNNTKNNYIINNKLLSKINYKLLYNFSKKFKNIIKNGIIIKKNHKIIKIFNLKNLIKYIRNKIKTKIKKQRYKGLGEMNPQQLWSTTMNPLRRNLIKIKINNKKNANKIFSTLMGNKINKRKKFIKNFYKNINNN